MSIFRSTAKPAVSIRRSLMQIVLIAVLPMGIFTAGLLYFAWQVQQTQRNEEQLARVKTMAALVEDRLQSSIERLQYLASDPLLAAGDLRGFHVRARQLVDGSDDWDLVMLQSDTERLLDTQAPFGRALVQAPQPYQLRALQDGKPVVSDLHTGRVYQQPSLGIAVPVPAAGGARTVLVARLRESALSDSLRRSVPEGTVAGVFDRNLVFVARARDPKPWIGKPPGAALLAAMQGGREGVVRSATREGVPTFTAWTRLANGWSIGVATPSAPVDRAIWRYLGLLGGLWVAMLVTGFYFARRVWTRIEDTVASTVETTRRLAAGQPATFAKTAIAEMEALSTAIATLFERERAARAQAEVASASKDEFLAMLGHELRNPLAPIRTALQLMQLRAPAALQKERAIIGRQVQHMVRLVDDLLDVARIARGNIPLSRALVGLDDIVAQAAETAMPLIEQKRQRLRVDAADGPLYVLGDAARLVQVVSNLLVNAAKFSSDDAPITLSVRQAGDQAEIEVADQGIGIPAAELALIFQRFVQGQQGIDRAQGGLGLGLAIAHSLAQLHGGDLSAASGGLGQGSRFTLRLPLADAPSESRPVPLDDPIVSHHPDAGAGRRVLLVDDNADARVTLAQWLVASGFVVEVAHDGPSALPAASDGRFDCAVLDIGLPGMDGYELAGHLRRAPGGERLRLVALTGYGQASDRERTQAAGFDVHLVKPVDLEELIAALTGTA